MWLEQGGETFFPLPRHEANQNNHQRVGESTAASLFFFLRCEVVEDACVGLDASSDIWPKLFFFFSPTKPVLTSEGTPRNRKYKNAGLCYTKMLLSLQIHAKLANQWLVIWRFWEIIYVRINPPPKNTSFG